MSSLVAMSVYRGPRPTTADAAAIQYKFATVISLEGIEEDAKEAIELSPVEVISHPILPLEIYLTGISQLFLTEILESIFTARKPVLVHCEHGEDRTGLVIAAYRVKVLGGSKERAMAEALQFGYRRWLNFGLNKTWRQV